MKTFQSINVINQSTLLHAYRQFAVVTDKKLDMYILKFTLSRIYACQLRSDKCHTVYSFHCTEGTAIPQTLRTVGGRDQIWIEAQQMFLQQRIVYSWGIYGL